MSFLLLPLVAEKSAGDQLYRYSGTGSADVSLELAGVEAALPAVEEKVHHGSDR